MIINIQNMSEESIVRFIGTLRSTDHMVPLRGKIRKEREEQRKVAYERARELGVIK